MTTCQAKETDGLQIKAVWSHATTCTGTRDSCCASVPDYNVPSCMVTVVSHRSQKRCSWQNLLSYLASQGQRGASGIVSGLFRPYVQEAFLEIYQATDGDAFCTADAPEKGQGQPSLEAIFFPPLEQLAVSWSLAVTEGAIKWQLTDTSF